MYLVLLHKNNKKLRVCHGLKGYIVAMVIVDVGKVLPLQKISLWLACLLAPNPPQESCYETLPQHSLPVGRNR